MNLDKMVKTIIDAVKHSEQKGTQPYDTTAEVLRIEGDTAWVHISGGVSETPVKLTINAVKGDIVQVRISGGQAWITGNATKPPTDDGKANIANQNAQDAKKKATTAFTTAGKAKDVADEASKIAGNTNQYFWHTETGTDTGAHITEIPKEEFLADPQNGGGNLLARSNGIAIRDGLDELATFGADGAQIGQDEDSHAKVTKRQFILEKGNESYVEIGIKNDADGTLYIWTRYPARTLTHVSSMYHVLEITSAKYSDDTDVDIAISSDGYGFDITNRQNLAFTVWYTTDSPVPVFTLGRRRSTSWGAYSMVEGYNNDATNGFAHAEGDGTTASGTSAHAEGRSTVASGDYSHAEGNSNTASGENAHAEGHDTIASGISSHAGGYKTIAQGNVQTAIGTYNYPSGTPDTLASDDFLFMVGNGADDNNRSNAFGVRNNGNACVKGGVWVDCNADGSGGWKLRKTRWNDYDITNLNFSAGTIGTRAHQTSINCAQSGYKPVGFTIRHISDSSAFFPLVFFNDAMTLLYVNFYRAKSTAYSMTGTTLTVRVFYEEES